LDNGDVAREHAGITHRHTHFLLHSKISRFILLLMTEIITYRGRAITSEDILSIRELIAAHPGESRRTLPTRLCESRQRWQANGALRNIVCGGLHASA
jgi:hypothetical protein